MSRLTRTTLQRISELRRREARALLEAGYFAGAYYLAGYSVECGLKACLAKKVQRYDFPDKHLANEAFTHDLKRLVRAAGLAAELESDLRTNRAFELNWGTVKDWSETERYELGITRARASELYFACAGRHGVLAWIKRRW